MTVLTNRAETRSATRLAFFVAGFGIACWAPLVPYARQRLGVDEGTLGLLLLCLGIGSVLAMPLTGVISSRLGSRPVIIAGGLGLAIFLPLLSFVDSGVGLGVSLFFFGASLGAIDVAMNIHAVEVEKGAGKPLMSGFHALFSIGGFVGALLMTGLLSLGLGPLPATLFGAVLIVVAMLHASSRLLRGRHGHADEPLFAMPQGIVLILAGLAMIGFLAEGAVLDWGGLLLVNTDLLQPAQSGLGYVVFSIAMTAGRLVGDRVTARLGDRVMVRWGGLIVVVGFAVLLIAPVVPVALLGFLLVGLGAANIVPVFFRRAGAQAAMPAGLAISAITTAGYAGVLVGPATIGFIAQLLDLRMAFWLLVLLFCLVPLLAGRVTPTRG